MKSKNVFKENYNIILGDKSNMNRIGKVVLFPIGIYLVFITSIVGLLFFKDYD